MEPHPFVPILATSGLDSDVKIWAPTSGFPPAMKDLGVVSLLLIKLKLLILKKLNEKKNKINEKKIKFQCVKTNMKRRADDITREPDPFDSRMLAVFLRHISRYRRFRVSSRLGGIQGASAARRAANDRSFGDNSDSSNDSSSSSRNSDSQSDDDMEGHQCSTS